MLLSLRKNFIKIGRIITVFVVILGWIFSAWPQILNFPPEIHTTKAITPQNGRVNFVAAWDPDIYWVLDSTDLGTNYGDSVAAGDDNTAVVAGDISTQSSYEGMSNINDDGAGSDFDIHLTNDSAWLMYIPSGMTHSTVYGLWSNGGGTNAQGAFSRATATGVEIACSHNNAANVMDTVIYEIPDAQLDNWFMIGCQFNSHGGSEGDMAIWIDGVAEGSGTRVNTLDYGSGDPDFGNNTGNEPDQSDVIYPVSYSGGDWGTNTAITSSGILIANFTADNPSGGASDTSAGNGDTFYTDYYDDHNIAGDAPITNQLHFRWRDDTTALNTSGGWLASEDSNGIADADPDTNYRLRFEVANTGAVIEVAARTYEIQYGRKSSSCGSISSWIGMADATDEFDMVDSTNITSDGQATTALLANTETYTFVAGEGRDVTDTTGSIGALTNDYYTEIEYSFEPTNSTDYGATYCFRLYDTTADSALNTYNVYPEITMTAGDPVIRTTEYYLTTGDFTGTTYDLVLDQNLEENHFILIKGSKVDNGGSNPDSDYVRVYELPSAISGELADSGGLGTVSLSRHVADFTWEGVVTVVECLAECTTNGFTTLDIVETSLGDTVTSGTDTSGTAWSDINDVVLFGGFWGGGAEFEADATDTVKGNAVQTRLYPSATDTLNWARESTESLVAATMTTYVVEWGSNWTVQHVNVSGSNVGDGCDATGEYNTGAITSVVRNNTWVWGTGYATTNGIGDSFSGALITLGDGVAQNTNETLVGFCGEYASTKSADIYTMTHASLAVDYKFKVDGNVNDTDTAVAVDIATDGTRMAMVHNGCNGSGTAHPRDRFWARYTADNEVTVSRGYNGQDFPAWIQGIDFIGLQVAPVTISISLNTDGTIALGTVSLDGTQDTTAGGINDIEVVSVDNGPADLDIRSTNFTEGGNTWTLAGTSGADQIIWQYSSSTPWYTMTTADTLYDFDQAVPESNTRNLVFKITMPSSSASFSQYGGTVTVVASSPQ
ncbi:hypothetical protein HON36_04885 [Candidatus Parcubacteria bacterium]|jgi:hypothetical protein|nr:hypothetical protein [Candidatus Parcubacteria bacterium]MBT7228866.1 hypothetical protein [Candidatus Parcubacteria bacterium]